MSGSGDGRRHHRPFAFFGSLNFSSDKNARPNMRWDEKSELKTVARAFPVRGPLPQRLACSEIPF